MGKKLNLTNKKFGRLTAIENTGKRGSNNRFIWLCKCECGKYKEVNSKDLLRKHTKSCGCLNNEKRTQTGKSTKTHGHTCDRKQTLTYNSWMSMKYRCLNPKQKGYEYWGGRGITICERWMKFENFLEDMGERPEGMTLDRIDNDGNYEHSNCKWSTLKEQNNNRRNK